MTYKYVFAVLLLGLLTAGVIIGLTRKPAGELYNQSVLSSIPKRDASNINTDRLAKGLVAPTNSWMSSLALGAQLQPVFPLPLSFMPAQNGFSISQPTISATSNTIFGSHRDDISLRNDIAKSYKLTRYDKLTATLTYYAGPQAVYRVTITEGSPYIFVRALQASTFTVSGGEHTKESQGVAIKVGATYYEIVSDAMLATDGKTSKVSLGQGQLATLVALPSTGSSEEILAYAKNEVTGSVITGEINGSQATTTYRLVTANKKPSLLGMLPHQEYSQSTIAEYKTLYGPLRLVACSSCTSRAPLVRSGHKLPLDHLSEQQKNELRQALKNDVVNLTFQAEDSYFAGKELYRAANLYTIAQQLGDVASKDAIKRALRAELDKWLISTSYSQRSIKSFYYDTKIHGLVGQKTAFGSEVFNDHHFHYGYLIYAAAVLASDDATLKDKWSSMVNIIAADIASPTANKDFPAYRNFDPLVGHSWASGDGQFADGNNQESSSEAINAWNAVSIWANVSGNNELKKTADWMLSLESASARAYWRAPDLSAFAGYDHSIVSLNWGGKRDYATFFSADPKAILGIQLIPLFPGMSVNDGTQAAKNMAAITGSDGSFSDFIYMYQAANGKDVLDKARQLSQGLIDGSNSRTYMLAWIMSHKNQ